MSETRTKSEPAPITLPPRMRSKLERYRRRVWVIKIAEGALAAVFGLVVSYLLVFGLDRLFDTPALLRGAILVAGGVGMVILFPIKYHDWVWSHRRLDQVARLLAMFDELRFLVLLADELERRSVPLRRVMWNCSGVSRARHWASVMTTFSTWAYPRSLTT